MEGSGWCDCNGDGQYQAGETTYQCNTPTADRKGNCSDACQSPQLPTPAPTPHVQCKDGQVKQMRRSAERGEAELVTVAALQKNYCPGENLQCKVPGVEPADTCMLENGEVRGQNKKYDLKDGFTKQQQYSCYIIYFCTENVSTAVPT